MIKLNIRPFVLATAILTSLFIKLNTYAIATVRPEREINLADSEYVEFTTAPSVKNALFKLNSTISYSVTVKNTYANEQKGTVGYIVTSLNGKLLAQSKKEIAVGPKSDKSYSLDIPAQGTGFYNLKLTINVSDYDDTIKKVFGVNPEDIRAKHPKPADFDQFWEDTKKELASVEPHYRVTEHPELAKGNTQVYLVEMQSLEDLTVRAWMTIAKDRKPKEKFPVWVILPGYQGSLYPVYGPRDLVIISLNIRGQGNSRDVINTERDAYLTTRIEDKNKFVLRGAIMDCVRCLDFICSRPDLDSKSIICAGGSMGAYLSVALASIDKRVVLCSANNPVFCDFRELPSTDWPLRDVEMYAQKNALKLDALLRNLDYYDLKNFAPDFDCKAIVALSLMDNLAPPYNEFAMINSLKRKPKTFIYPDLGHEVPPSLFKYLSSWMMDNLGIF